MFFLLFKVNLFCEHTKNNLRHHNVLHRIGHEGALCAKK